ncbi:hypothetical protein HETIRDRAFT_309755 [Heterobasidion irregulare TC 32-1]|uniref:Trafficking protein particle complex subunit 10 n=1 Tax=Heterobasidion irregulare (strain TC 32-1) TaxID=747525 RepID=W4KJG3_HETIT|nr:uncharacterized protein HETIRDRAFT_309755 [Heterobasidion irregulare TC 32-1]ETW85992.1 hypothetical protein HETIRDRAFT_309755 [Heterobasidion irregulare TC 32-1]
MAPQRALITYSASLSFLSSDYWQHLQNGLSSQLPLRNLHWKPVSRPSIRTIQELEVELVALDSVRDEHTSQVPSTLLEKPLLNLYVVTCEDNETYKTSVRKQIKEWHTIVSQRKNQEWLLLHVTRPDARSAASGFFQMKGSVLDKIRADFNLDKRDRCVQLSWTTGQDNPAAWADLISKIKEGILSAFDSAVAQRSEDVKRSDSQRGMPGWNFCTFFILKESLASSFEGMNLFEDALLQYDELEISFTNVISQKSLLWFGTLILAGQNDDSVPLLSIDKKPYRDLILANAISVFDFRIYLLARQCALLGKVGRVADVCRKASKFLSLLGRQLRDVEDTLPQYFVESWIYSSALSVVEDTEPWARGLEASSLTAFNASKAELLELARNQLTTIGIKAGHLPSKPPFTMALFFPSPSINGARKRSSQKISRTDLLASLEDEDAFYELYVSLTNRAIELNAKAGRRKSALKLHWNLAALDVHRERLPVAFQTFSSLPAHYSPHKWIALESYMLSQAIDIHAALGSARDQQWINIALSFLKSYVDDHGSDLLVTEDDKAAYVSRIVVALQDLANNIDSDLIHSEHPAISIKIVNPNARLAGSEDGSFVDVLVNNRLPCEIPVDEVSVTLTGRESERLVFNVKTRSLASGMSTLTLFCPTSSWGTFIFDSSEVRISRLHFQWVHRQPAEASKLSRQKAELPVLVRLARDLCAFDVRIKRPRCIKLGAPSSILMTVGTGRNQISKAIITLSSTSGVQFRSSQAKLESDGSSGALECNESNVTLVDVDKETVISVLVPHSDASALHAMQVDISVEYTTEPESSISRSLWLTCRVPTLLPVAVNVQDFFRGSKLFSKFTISTTSYQHIRLATAQLKGEEGEEGLVISSTHPHQRSIITITPSRPANFLFQLECQNGRVRDPLCLSIKYRMLRDEIEGIIEQTVDAALAQETEHVTHRSILIDRVIQTLEGDAGWVQLYGVTGELDVPDTNEEGEIGQILRNIKEVLRQNKNPSINDGTWRELQIPVDVPIMNILVAARIHILANPFTTESTSSDQLPPLYAGQPISALLTMHATFRWGTRNHDDKRGYKMRFDIEEMLREWLVSGRKRGDFEAQDGSTYTVPITFIALHHGELSLPKVSVTALPLAGEMTMGSLSLPSVETYQIHGAEKILVLPRGGRSTFVVGMGEGID